VERRRCAWARGALEIRYHDREWGVPLHHDRRLFELLILEGAQAGLSWSTILKKRPAYRQAFDRFDPARIARYSAVRVRRLMNDAGIVRNRAKIEATIANARATVDLRDGGSPLSELVWAHRPEPRPAPNSLADMPAQLPEAAALAKALKRSGFRFVGPTTVYAAMQACGLVHDHVATCPVRPRAEAAQAAVAR
jgi:DNA-3-methyladenine glycosylase I